MSQQRTWPYGTELKVTVLTCATRTLSVGVDGTKEAHILVGTGHDMTLKPGDKGTITFTRGGPTGGYWVFKKAPTQPQNEKAHKS